uniref:hypothetical protein n=1 Tax=Micromonospora acroterricola TaxID=2202421 RepID=UPI00191C2595|nr:hypothetical protein [Micromonospora acroterricola]
MSSDRSAFNARNAASIAYATEETGSAITANANANSSTGRLFSQPPLPFAGGRARR